METVTSGGGGAGGGALSVFSSASMPGMKRPCPDNSDDTSDSDSECTILRQDLLNGIDSSNGALLVAGPKPGKKTKGRVKIKMEFIENKLRRYTTFSKRKTGIMKKAYELSTLTGTQVMLLVASETGHVYTFATRKLQPMITSESGKALIQTCLNSPDSPLDIGKTSADQRMNPTGYEETDLSYMVSDDEICPPVSSSPSKADVARHQLPVPTSSSTSSSSSNRVHQSTTPSTRVEATSSSASASSSSSSSSSHHQLLYQLGQDIATSTRPPGPLSSSDIRLKQEPASSINQVAFSKDIQSRTKETSVCRAPVLSMPVTTTVTSPGTVSSSSPTSSSSLSSSSVTLPSLMVQHSLPASGYASSQHQPQQQQQQQQTFYKIPGTNQIISLSLTGANSQGAVLYQTYTTSSSSASTAPEGYLLNLPQANTRGTMLETSNGATQQFITIPVPVSLSNNSQMFHPLLAHSAPIKSEMLPTDLRYASIEKSAK